MRLHPANYIIALATVFTGCYGPRVSQLDNEQQLRHYDDLMSTHCGEQFARDKAETDYSKNAKTFKLGNTARMDIAGTNVRDRDRKLVFDFAHGLTLQCYRLNIEYNKKLTGYRYVMPMRVLGIANGQPSKVNDRYNQVKQHGDNTVDLNVLEVQQGRFTYDAGKECFVEKFFVANDNTVPAEIIYYMNKDNMINKDARTGKGDIVKKGDITFKCGNLKEQVICNVQSASPELTDIFEFLDDKKTVMAMTPGGPK
jgi:hypothetical protein